MVDRKRDRALTVRVLEAELEMLSELAELEGVNASEWIRNTIRREHAVAFRGRPSKRPKQKR
jgi:hypothetical protein